MYKLLLACFLAAASLNNATACLNGETKSLKDGTFLYSDDFGKVPHGHTFNSAEEFEKAVVNMDSLYRLKKDISYLSDKGLLLILLKRYDEAINLYLEVEKIRPRRYSTASNLGTAYELAGNNEQALFWIKKAVGINPHSHQRSEWIHVNILETKIKGAAANVSSEALIGTDFGKAAEPSTTLNRNALAKLHEALYYQLNERVSFIKTPDPIVAQLLFD
ncbi:MAG: tetratricopeptide repeat protein, partial [Pedobacter sp.]